MREPKLIPNPHFLDVDAHDEHLALYGWARDEGRIVQPEDALEAAQSTSD